MPSAAQTQSETPSSTGANHKNSPAAAFDPEAHNKLHILGKDGLNTHEFVASHESAGFMA